MNSLGETVGIGASGEGLNLLPPNYNLGALPIELHRHAISPSIQLDSRVVGAQNGPNG